MANWIDEAEEKFYYDLWRSSTDDAPVNPGFSHRAGSASANISGNSWETTHEFLTLSSSEAKRLHGKFLAWNGQKAFIYSELPSGLPKGLQIFQVDGCELINRVTREGLPRW